MSQKFLIIEHVEEQPQPFPHDKSYIEWSTETETLDDVLATYCEIGDTYWEVTQEDYNTHFDDQTVPSSGGTIYNG